MKVSIMQRKTTIQIYREKQTASRIQRFLSLGRETGVDSLNVVTEMLLNCQDLEDRRRSATTEMQQAIENN